MGTGISKLVQHTWILAKNRTIQLSVDNICLLSSVLPRILSNRKQINRLNHWQPCSMRICRGNLINTVILMFLLSRMKFRLGIIRISKRIVGEILGFNSIWRKIVKKIFYWSPLKYLITLKHYKMIQNHYPMPQYHQLMKNSNQIAAYSKYPKCLSLIVFITRTNMINTTNTISTIKSKQETNQLD